MTTPSLVASRAAAVALESYVTECLNPVLRGLSKSQRRVFALDLCALLDFSTPEDASDGSRRVSPNGGSLRAAVMIDHVPGMNARAACVFLDGLSEATRGEIPEVDHLHVFDVHDVVLIANAPRLVETLQFADARITLIDVLPCANPPLREESVIEALANASKQLASSLRTRSAGSGNPRVARDLVAAMGAFAVSTPLPTLVGACLGYPRVYAWSPADDVAAAARALSTMPLELYEVRATFIGDSSPAARKHRVCGFTAPFGSEKENRRVSDADWKSSALDVRDQIANRRRDVTAWFETMKARAASAGEVWTDLELNVQMRNPGPVAL
jgi:hypothetical protein